MHVGGACSDDIGGRDRLLLPPLSPQTQPMDWDDGSHGSSEEDDFEEEEETPIAPVSILMCWLIRAGGIDELYPFNFYYNSV